MRPVVFGPSPLMQAALGVVQGQDLGREREAEQVRAQREAEAADRRAQLDALTIAQRTIANTEATDTTRRRQARAARVQADAERLRASPFNADGKYGQPGEPVDVEHDYAADLEKEAKVGALKQALVAGGMPEADAEARARWNVDKDALANEATTRRQAREKQAADIARIKAQTALDAARAAMERSGGKQARAEVTAAKREDRDRRREFQSTLTRRPRQSQYVDPVTRMPDLPAYEEALANWRADSTERKGAADDAAADLRTLVPGMRPVAPAPAPKASTEPVPSDDEIDAAIDALEQAGQAATVEAVKAEVIRRRKAG